MANPRYDHLTVFNYLHNYGADLEARRVFFHNPMELSEHSHEIGVEYIARNLLHLDKWKGPIELWINTPGGSIHEMFGLIDIMESLDNPVDTIAYGLVASAGCLLLVSGTGTRYAMRNARFMWHAGTTDIHPDMHWPDARDRLYAEHAEGERWLDAMAERTKPPKLRGRAKRKEFWARYARGVATPDFPLGRGGGGELWLSAQQMKEFGVVDAIYGEEE